jgi:hypothetical protein
MKGVGVGYICDIISTVTFFKRVASIVLESDGYGVIPMPGLFSKKSAISSYLWC